MVGQTQNRISPKTLYTHTRVGGGGGTGSDSDEPKEKDNFLLQVCSKVSRWGKRKKNCLHRQVSKHIYIQCACFWWWRYFTEVNVDTAANTLKSCGEVNQNNGPHDWNVSQKCKNSLSGIKVFSSHLAWTQELYRCHWAQLLQGLVGLQCNVVCVGFRWASMYWGIRSKGVKIQNKIFESSFCNRLKVKICTIKIFFKHPSLQMRHRRWEALGNFCWQDDPDCLLLPALLTYKRLHLFPHQTSCIPPQSTSWVDVHWRHSARLLHQLHQQSYSCVLTLCKRAAPRKI